MRPLCCTFAAALLLLGCEATNSKDVVDEANRQAQEAARQAQEAARQAEQGLEVARDQAGKAADVAARQASQTADEAARQAERGLEQAREGLADAQLTAAQRLDQAKQQLGARMGDAADAFEQVAESSKQQAAAVSKQIETASKGIEISPGMIKCDENSKSRICRIDPNLIAQLATEPRALAREVSLRPGEGSTGKGLELARAAAEGFASSLGLRQGDILLELNGAKLDSFGAIRNLDGALSGSSEAKLIYERDGKREQLTVVQQQ